jgi:signal transduction histidine kinase
MQMRFELEPLEAVLATEELDLRPFRAADHARENQALRELMAIYGEHPEDIRSRLVELVMERCGGDGAGLSVLVTEPDGTESLRWIATSGSVAQQQGRTVPLSISPGRVVIEQGTTQLMIQPARSFQVMENPVLAVQEEMITPFVQDGRVLGTLWVVTHDADRKFDTEDQRMLESLALFAAMAWQRHISYEAARQSVETLNSELEVQVARRTEDLVSKNQELEGFTYSVSHDLRAPLRAMVANSVLLQEEEGPRISEEGRARLERLGRAARRMAVLLDDLLGYARLGKREVQREKVDLSALAAEVVREIDPLHGEVVPLFEIELGMTAECDPRLVGMALQNLFENACKYRSVDRPFSVQFGCAEGVYYVRDNGMGFDMEYVAKLFKPFERLHREEYSGTGIGLANVKRVVERHGGLVWAEGAPGVGATFYFTLGA